MNKRIWFLFAYMGDREQDFVKEALDMNWVVPLGPNMNAFELSLVEYLHEDRHVVVLSAGTATLHLGLILLDVKPGDEVICQSFTFAASANPILYLEAKPVFVSSEEDTWNIDPVLLEEVIKDRLRKTGKFPKAIISVHLYGMPAKMDEAMDTAGCHGISVLEDATGASGSELNGQKCGTFGELVAPSFSGNRMIITSGGGVPIRRTGEEAKQTKFYVTQARDAASHYQHIHIGYNYRMSNICAGISRGQTFVFDEHVARRRAIHTLYTELLKDASSITVLQNPDERLDSNFWLTCTLVDPSVAGKTREDIRLKLDVGSIETRPLWKPMHPQPVSVDAPFYGNGTSEHLFDIGLCLPSGPILTDEDIRRVVGTIRQDM